MATVVLRLPFGRISRSSLGGNSSLPSAANKVPLSSTRYKPCPPPNKCIPLYLEQDSSFPSDSCEPSRRAPRNYLAPSRDQSESASSMLSKQETTWCRPHSRRHLQLD